MYGERLIVKAELLVLIPYTIQHIYRLEKAGRFPRRVRVGANRVAWVLSEVEAWMAHRISAREGAPVEAGPVSADQELTS